MTAAEKPALPGQAGSGGLLEKLMAAVRPEFRADVLLPDPGDSVLGWTACLFTGCGRPVIARGLCTAHHRRWKLRGRPGLAAYLASAERPIAAAGEPAKCIVPGCGRCGTAAGNLCQGHAGRWRRAGYPAVAAWAQACPPPADRRSRAECALPGCTRWADPLSSPFCQSHTARWITAGRPDVTRFTEDCELRGRAHIDLRGLAPQLKLELQYAIQRRRDERSVTLPYLVAQWAVRRAAAAGISSLLDCDDLQWQALAGAPLGGRDTGGLPRRGRVFLGFARDQAEMLRDGAGWETEYGRDVWRLARLPGLTLGPGQTAIRDSCLRLDRITQPWLRKLAKRWLRLRLSSGLAVTTIYHDTQAVTVFSAFLATAAPEVHALAGIGRPLLERYLAWLATQPGGKRLREKRLGPLQALFRDIRRYGWDDTLPTTAMFFTEDFPKNDRALPRALAEHVMAQVELPANLDRWNSPERRLMTLIMIRGGLRLASVATIAFDCLRHDGQAAPYLLYRNTKMKREAAVPIDAEIKAGIKAQQARILERWPAGSPYLFPRPQGNADGRRPATGAGYRSMLTQWLASCDIRDEHDRPVRLTPHQWRHTFATRLKMSRIASHASFGSSREHALPAAQRVALRCRRPSGPPRGCSDLGLHGLHGSDATMMRLIPLRGLHHHCACWHHDASGSSRLHRVHHRRTRQAVPGRTAAARDAPGLRIIGHVTRLTWQPAALVAPDASPRPGDGCSRGRQLARRPRGTPTCRHAADVAARVAVAGRWTLLAWTCNTAAEIHTRNHQPGSSLQAPRSG